MKVVPRKNKSGSVTWVLDFGRVRGEDGKERRKREYYKTRDKAEGALARARSLAKRHGQTSLALSEAERLRFEAARDQLAAVGSTIEAAVAFYIRRHAAVSRPLQLAELLRQAVAEKELLFGGRYPAQFKSACLAFVRGRETMPAHEVTREDVQSWVLGNGWAPKTQRNYLTDLRTLFEFGRRARAVAENPCAPLDGHEIQLAPLPEGEPVIFRPALVRRLFVTLAAREEFRPLLTYAALAFFCGVRPEGELGAMDRAQVSLTARHAIVKAAQAKTRARRVVDIPENAIEWMRLDPLRSGPITGPNFRRRWEAARTAAGLLAPKGLRRDRSRPDHWPHDVARHTFASYHYAAHQDEALLKAQMGHSKEEDTLFRFYRALATPAKARLFWSVRPSLSVCT